MKTILLMLGIALVLALSAAPAAMADQPSGSLSVGVGASGSTNVAGDASSNSASTNNTIKRVITDCIKGALGGTTIAGIISSIDSVKGAAKFVIRRVGFLAAVGCAGAIIYDYA